MKNIIYFLAVCVGLVGYNLTSAQQGSDLLRQAAQTFQDSKHWSVQYEVSVFPTWTSTEAFEQSEGMMAVSPEGRYDKMMDVEQLVTPELSLLVDHIDQTIALFSLPKEKVKEAQNPGDLLTGWLKSENQPMKVEEISGKTFLSLPLDHPEYSAMRVELDDQQQLSRIALYLKGNLPSSRGGVGEPPRVEFRYWNMKTEAATDVNLFSRSRFINQNRKDIRPAEALAGYTILN